MPSSFRRSLPIAGVAVLLTAAPAQAETPAAPAPHVRPDTALASELFAELTERSTTVRVLVDRLQRSDVVVYIRHRWFTETTLDGRTGIVQSDRPTRLVIVELSCARSRRDQLVALGHELQHTVEIAEAPGVVDAPSPAGHFAAIGTRMKSLPNAVTFETDRAMDVADRVRRELSTDAGRSSDERD